MLSFLAHAITVKSNTSLSFDEKRSFKFQYNYQNDVFRTTELSSDFNEALKLAALKCFQYYSQKVTLNESKGIELIDICANPKG